MHGQWPDDFNFDITRAINTPSQTDTTEKERSSEDLDEKKRDPSDVSAEPIVSSEAAAAEEERELDPVALGKAYRLAARSSVALVRLLLLTRLAVC